MSNITIREVKDNKYFGVLYLKQKTLNTIYKDSGSLAKHNEFQVHYTSLIGKYKNQGGEVLYINIPLVFYNYKQTVSPAHIDFDLKDVEEMHNKTLPIAQEMANEIVEKFNEFPLELEWSIVGFQSKHKHPSGYNQGFSGTDLDTNAKNPGIVYPLLNIEEPTPNFAAIMYINNDMLEISSCSQMRVAIKEKNTITYHKGRNFTYIEGYTIEPTEMEKLFDKLPEIINDKKVKDGLETPLFMGNLKAILKDYEPEVFVDKDNLSKKKYDSLGYGYVKDFKKKGQLKWWEIEAIEEEEEEVEIEYEDDLFEVNEKYQYVWEPNSLNKKDKKEYIDMLRDEIFLSAENMSSFEVSKFNDKQIIELAKKLGILAKDLQKYPYTKAKK